MFDTSALALTDMEQPNIAYGRRHVRLELPVEAFAPRAVPAPPLAVARPAVALGDELPMARVAEARAAGHLHRHPIDDDDGDPPGDEPAEDDEPPSGRPPRRPVSAASSFGVRAVVGWVDDDGARPPPPVLAPAIFLIERYRLTSYARGFGLGDHLYSFTLFPEEEVEIEIKTWKTSEATTKAGSSIFDGQSEEAESEFASAVEQENTSNRRQEQAQEAHVEASAEASWGWGSASVSGSSTTSSAEAAEQFARNMSNATQKIANKATRERRIEITQSNETKTTEGEETHTRRRIKNINKCRTLNYNYFQLLRKYETRLELYDLRLLLSTGQPYFDAASSSWRYETEEVALGDAGPLFARALVPDAVERALAAVVRHAGPGSGDEPGLDVLVTPARSRRPLLDNVALATQMAWEDAVRAAVRAGQPPPPRPVARLPRLLSREARVVATNAVYVEAMLGQCDACEDFVTDSRVLEIEARQLDNRRLELELERLAVETAHRRQDPVERRALAFEGLPPGATVQVFIDGVRSAPGGGGLP